MFERRVHTHHLRVGLGIDQARVAVASAAADALARARVLFVQHDAQGGVKRPQPDASKIFAELLHARLMADSGVRIRRRSGRLRRVLATLPVDLVEALGLGVVRLEILVRDGPSRGDTAVMPNFTEVLFAKTEECRTVK